MFFFRIYICAIFTILLSLAHSGKFVTLAGDLLRQVFLKNSYCGSLLRQKTMKIPHAVEFSGRFRKNRIAEKYCERTFNIGRKKLFLG